MKTGTHRCIYRDYRAIQLKVIFFTILIVPALLFAISAYGAVIFQDNFDNVTGAASYSSGGTSSYPAGWAQWMVSSPSSKTEDGITHYSGEISAPGRGGSGKSLKIWRHSAWPNYNSYSGSLHYDFFAQSAYREVYLRYYMKLPAGMNIDRFDNYVKLWRFTLPEGRELYLNFGTNTGTGTLQNSGFIHLLDSITFAQKLLATGNVPWDSAFHCYEFRIKLNTTGNSDGALEFWLDGARKYSNTSFNFNAKTSDRFIALAHFSIGNRDNESSPWQNSWQAFEFDDFVLSTTYVGPDGSEPSPEPAPSPSPTATLFNEGFDDNNFASRGWFDDTSVDIDTSTKYSGTGSLRLTWGVGQTRPPLVMAMRKDFTATDSLYVSMYWRLNSNWVGSGQGYHPHLVYILSDRDDHWGGLAANYLDTYVEPHGRGAYLILQDLLNSPAVCGSGCFYTPSITFSLNTWYHIETYFKMNTVSGGAPVPDGIMQMWVDGVNVYNATNRIYRNGQNPNLKWRTFVIAPWIGDGSPQAQTMWIDELTVATGLPGAPPQPQPAPTPPQTPPAAPTGLRILPQ